MSNQFTWIEIQRNEAGQIVKAELWNGFGDWDPDKFLLDIYNPESGANDAEFGYDEGWSLTAGGQTITIPAPKRPEQLVQLWVENPPNEPTEAVRLDSAWEEHIDREIDREREDRVA